MRSLVWFRGQDMRVRDHEPLRAAVQAGELLCVYVLEDHFLAEGRAKQSAHAVQYLLESLTSLRRNIEALGGKLVVLRGDSAALIPTYARAWKVDQVLAYRAAEPRGIGRDQAVQLALDVPLVQFEGRSLVPHDRIKTGSGGIFAVFTPYSRAHGLKFDARIPLPAPKALPAPPAELKIEEGTIPTLDDYGIKHNALLMPGGERAAQQRLADIAARVAPDYADTRNAMGIDGTSRLSAPLRFGVLSPRQVWHAVESAPLRRQLVWRDFAYYTMFHRPDVLSMPFRADFWGFPYEEDDRRWTAWAQGQTGYPLIDAAARELLATGFVHNRARMNAASFLTKHLLISYKRGEQHYLHHLTDGDFALNNMGWQWSAGSGCDAQPYFRVFNPMTQGADFDPAGDYVRRCIPELSQLHAKYIYAPWTAPPAELQRAGVKLGSNYPYPIVEHKAARERFLAVAKAHLTSTPAQQEE